MSFFTLKSDRFSDKKAKQVESSLNTSESFSFASMGVYVYKSKHIDAIKVGHYSKQNAWSRVSNRGFHSCQCPSEIKGKVNVDDLDLLCLFPLLTPRDEKKLHADLAEYRLCGEWFGSEALDKINAIVSEENKAAECSKTEAVQTKRRL